MRYADICWKGIHASDLGVIVTEQVNYKRPALRRETVTIPGRSGTLEIKQRDAWDCVTYTPGLAIRPDADRETVYRWLQGRGQIIFGSMPDSVFDAVLIDQMDVTEQVPGHPAGYQLLIPTFECQPYRYEVTPAAAMEATVTAELAAMLQGFNPMNADAAPLITVKVTPGTVLTLTMDGGETAVIEAPEGETEALEVVLDCEAQTAYTTAGTALDGVMLGEFPLIAPGSWTLTATAENGSIKAMRILPRWRSV